MQPVIYLDVLFFINMFVNYFLLKATALFTKTPTRVRSLLLGAVVGTAYSLLFIFDDLAVLYLWATKLIFAGIIVTLTFRQNTIAAYLKLYAVFLTVNLLFAGFIVALRLFSQNNHIQFNNGILYYDISIVTLTVSTIVSYLLITLLYHLVKSRAADGETYQVRLCVNGKRILLRGFMDTGNQLKDCFSGLPVVIGDYRCLKSVLNTEQLAYVGLARGEKHPASPCAPGMRLVVYDGVEGTSVLPAFTPEEFTMIHPKTGKNTSHDVLVAVSKTPLMAGNTDLLLNKHLVS